MLAWKIALRYLLARKSHRAVNVISVISMVGVAVASAAIIIVLSVFNGFSDLAHSRLTILEPDIKIVPRQNKTIADADSLARAIALLPGVRGAMPTITERALLIKGDRQRPVVLHAVPDSFASVVCIDSAVIDGTFMTGYAGSPACALSVGVAVGTDTRPDPDTRLSIYLPRRDGRINPANPAAAFVSAEFVPTAVVRAAQDKFDSEGIIIPLSSARSLLAYSTEASAIEVTLNPAVDPEPVTAQIRAIAPSLQTLSRLQQLADAFKMIEIEKWVTFLLLTFILIIASFNIISTLSLLVIEKRDNMATLRALGAPAAMCRNIFIIEGWLITTIGGIIGIIIGALLALIQQFTGAIALNGDPATLIVNTYPCRLSAIDAAITLSLIIVLGFIIAQSTRLFSKSANK